MLVPRRLTGDLQPRATGWTSLAGLLLDYAVRARRLGFRAVIANAAMLTLTTPATAAERSVPADDAARLARDFPHLARGHERRLHHHEVEDEQTLAAIFDAPDSLLIDARNLNPSINGTANAILGLASAWHRKRDGLATTLWVGETSANFHRLDERFAGWRIWTSEQPPARMAAAVRLSQPWHVSEMLTLHAAAAVNVYLFLDTIAWDIAYTAPPELDTVWQMAARTADGLVFISEFSRQRYLRRFAIGPGVRTGVALLSLRPEDYVSDEREAPATHRGAWFIVGNTYDHKHVAPTVDILSRAFPTREFVVLGDRARPRGHRIWQLHSGRTPEAEVQGLYSTAGAVIFPSFYEGFGLPVVNALAYGRTVVARRSALLDEIAAAYRGPGRLIPFEDEADLVEQLTCLSRGLPTADLPLGTAGRPPHGWDDAVATIDGMVRRLVHGPPASQPREARRFACALLRDTRS
jgi:glycosyltransferase involved in cell wall biosynthesis